MSAKKSWLGYEQDSYRIHKMKQIVIPEQKFNVYSFNELSNEAKEKAVQYFLKNEYHIFHTWYDFIKEDFHDILSIFGFYNIKSYFSGFYNQGDGACFVGSYKYSKDFVKNLKAHAPLEKDLHEIAEKIAKIQKLNFYGILCEITHCNMYYHENTMRFDWNNGNNTSYLQSIFKNDSHENELEKCFKGLSCWYYDKLEKHYTRLQSCEAVQEYCECNEMLFLESGSVYYE